MDKKVKFSQRLLSMVIDFLLLLAVSIPLNIITYFLQAPSKQYFMVFELSLLLALWLCKDLIGGQSIGKRLFKHKVYCIDNNNNLWKFILRNIFTFIWIIEFIFCWINPSRRLGDLVCGTEVRYSDSNNLSFCKRQIIICFFFIFVLLLIVMMTVLFIAQKNPMVKLLYV